MQSLSPLALEILNTLEQAGFEAYLVGGCVRDLLLGRPVHDWDLTTSATPEQVQALFAKTVPTGLQHGTVTVLLRDEAFEVTTFRCDGGYSDSRRPDSVRFVGDLTQDLARRDFTINAMAMDARGHLTDCFGGVQDLEERRLRCVGEPDRRFQEDALRMLRAVRFSAQLGFSLDEPTEEALLRNAGLCRHLSAERIRDELEKTLLSPAPELLGKMIRAGLLAHLGLTGCPDLSDLGSVPAERLPRWAMAKVLLPALDLTALRLDRRTVRLCQAAAACPPLRTELDCKRAVSALGWDAARIAAALWGREETLDRIEASGDCVTLAQLAVKGSDLPLQGPAVSAELRRLLLHVLEHPEDNQKDVLLALKQP